MSFPIEHQAQDQEFTVNIDSHQGELAYSFPTEGVIDFTHTFVDKALRGQGVADALARQALDFAREQKLHVRTSCEFMEKFVQAHHAEYQDLLA
ncbi:N-acetyltransferase [Hymenobacter aerilatus]|uniref:N-acetyltransferase n=1 Tax=Hymenobacter aerilatus TaxID=2932251 RepID=A0A8T9SPW6_9BACT|nr:GNAT family N-acetyltransferase [Hymenobacter aerilatus]UOR03757.1 N-acetyltransferase [Hymenobacter aerilatus]